MVQKVWAECWRWLHLVMELVAQMVEAVLVEHYIAILPFKPKNWVMCHQPTTLDEAVAPMEAYVSRSGSLLNNQSLEGAGGEQTSRFGQT